MTAKERLQELQRQRNPLPEILKSVQMLKGDKGDQGPKGDPGYTPVKGKDYFTDSELQAVVDYLQSNVHDGAPGKDGADGKRGPAGETPRRLVDYWTEADQKKIISDVLKQIGKPKDGVSPKMSDIVKAVLEKINLPSGKDLITKTELSDFLRRGGFRGGGDTVAAGSGVTITNVNGVKVISAGGLSILTVLTGAIDDSNTVFTFASTPTLVVVNGATYRNGSSAMGGTVSISGVTVTLPNAVGTGGDLYALG